MTFTDMLGLGVALGVVGLAGCDGRDDSPRGEGEICWQCTESTSSTFGGGCVAWDEWQCLEGLHCDRAWSNTCRALRTAGETCDDRIELCGADAFCGPDRRCVARPTLGARCDAAVPCVEPLVCNGGGAPDDPRAGTCTPEVGEIGAPCTWQLRAGGAVTGGFMTRHCSEGLACVPLAAVDAAPVTAAQFDPHGCVAVDEDGRTNQDGRCLGWPGVCRAPGQGARGAPCAGDAACASGPCVRLAPPRMGAGWDALPPYAAAWPGVCAGADDAIGEPLCPAGAGCDLACASHADCLPGTLCTPFGGRCHSMYQVDVGDWCGQYDMLATFADDRWCRVGMTCDVDAMECRPAGTTLDGAACAAHADCAPGLVCAGTCMPPSGLGEPCDVDRRCAFELRCDRDALTCEAPGPGHQGGGCAHDDDCGKGLHCEDEHDVCQWLAREGHACSAQSQPCEPDLVCAADATGAGVCARAAP